jgi:putative oxidoreductase
MTIESSNVPSSKSVLSYSDGLAAAWQDFLLLVGRVMIGWIYIQSGWRKLQDVPAFAKTMPRRDLPEFLGYVAPPVEFFGGILIVLGCATRYAALLILLFTIIATFSSHRYWNFADPQEYGRQHTQFWKNVTMMGGLVLLFVTAGGRFSVDGLLRRRQT